jgi:hypothetical protein
VKSQKTILIIALLSLSFHLEVLAESKTAPKYGPEASRLFSNRAYIQKTAAPDFWALMPYYVHQRTGSACSIASATIVLNGIRAPENLTSSIDLFTQDSVLERTGNSKWKKAVGKRGGGTTLEELRGYFSEALEKLKLPGWQVEALHADASPEFAKKVREILIENEKSDRSFIITNYLQNVLTGDPEGAVGHVAPVAAYDAKAGKVLILDPDREYYEPYWVSEAAFIRSMNTLDRVSGKTRGMLWIRKGTPPVR